MPFFLEAAILSRMRSPVAKMIEQQAMLSLLTEAEQDDYFIEINLDGLLRGDILSRYRAYAIGRNWGWLSADEVREFENFNPLPDGKRSPDPLLPGLI